jgi:hypothetical protein
MTVDDGNDGDDGDDCDDDDFFEWAVETPRPKARGSLVHWPSLF